MQETHWFFDIQTMDDTPGYEFWINVLGEKARGALTQSVSDLRKFDIELVKTKAGELREKAISGGFEIRYLIDGELGNIDKQEFVDIYNKLAADMPKDDLEFEDAKFTVERLDQRYEEWIRKKKYRSHIFAALKDGIPIAYTETLVKPYQPQVGEQMMTGVIPEFRGNQLGLTLKYQMLELLLSKEKVEFWSTDNASSNKHMLKINLEMGYRPWLTFGLFQKKIR